jgi:hypothetical protein
VVERLHTHEHVGDRGLQPHELDALAGETARRSDDLSLDDRVDEFAQPGRDDDTHTVGQLQDHRQALAGRHRGAPDDVEAVGKGLGELEVGGARFVRDRDRQMRDERDRGHGKKPCHPANKRHGQAHGTAFADGASVAMGGASGKRIS